MKMNRVGELMEKAGIPGGDPRDLPTSAKRFPDGNWYRNEISGVERPQVLEALIDEMHKRSIPIHRVISVVMGATYLDRAELREFARLAYEARLEVILTPGPRSAWDTGRQLVTPEGAFSGLRFRGCDQLNQAITDIMRGIELGFRGFLVIDEGLLHLLHQMRLAGDLPQETIFKVSIYAGHANPAGGRLLQEIGAGTFNPVADLSLAQLAGIRKVVDVPMDLHILLTESFGGFTRFYDGPEMARTCAPCYFKIEPGPACAATPMALYKPWVSVDLLAGWAREKVKYAQTIHELIQENFPEATLSPQGPADLAVPVLT